MKIAIIGSGIAGMTCAHQLSQQHDITLFEAADKLGGHTATIDVNVDGRDYAIDTGFMVFNDKTYPNFIKLMDKLGIDSQPTEMSFSVVNPQIDLQYNGHDLNTLFSQRRNLLNPRFYKFINEILRFNKLALASVDIDPEVTLQQFLTQHGFSNYFAENYLLPMGAAIWSSTLSGVGEFSMRFFARFFSNHGLLSVNDRPQWYTLTGGSRSYIDPLLRGLAPNIELNSAVISVHRSAESVELNIANGESWQGDHVIFACHSDQALAILGDNATHEERRVLSMLKYQDNEVILHTDTTQLPSNPRAQASWNYRLAEGDDRYNRLASVTYDMKRLQALPSDAPQFCVTLNPIRPVAKEHIIERFTYAHPCFNAQTVQAQSERDLINGQHSTWFCGAYWYNGFHEDGVKSALDICQRLDCPL